MNVRWKLRMVLTLLFVSVCAVTSFAQRPSSRITEPPPPSKPGAVRVDPWARQSWNDQIKQGVSGLKEAGFSVEFAGERGKPINVTGLPGRFTSRATYTSANELEVEVQAMVGRQGGTNLSMAGSFKISADGALGSGTGAISLPSHSISGKFAYAPVTGWQFDAGVEQGLKVANVHIEQFVGKDSVNLGLKLGDYVKVLVDPFKLQKWAADNIPEAVRMAREQIGGVELSFDLGMLVLAITDQPPERMEELAGTSLVSLKRLLQEIRAGRGADLGPITRINGFLVDHRNEDLLLLGQCEAWSPKISTDVLVAVLRSVWRDGSYPYISIDPSDPADFSKPHRARWGGFSPGLEQSALAAIMFDADYLMKTIRMSEPPIAGMKTTYAILRDTANRRALRHPPKSHIQGMWFSPVKPRSGEIWELTTERGSLAVYQSQVELHTAKMEVFKGADNRIELRAFEGEATSPGKLETPGILSDFETAEVQTAGSFTLYFGQLERKYAEFKKLHQVYDLVAMATILRAQQPAHPLLKSMSDRPVPTVPVRKTYVVVQTTVRSQYQVPWNYQGGAVSRVQMDRARFQTARELDALFGQLNTLQWQGAVLRNAGVFIPVVRQAQQYRGFILADSLVEKAAVDSEQKRYKEARDKFTQALALAPDHYAALLSRAIVNAFLKDYRAIVADCSAAIAADPRWYEPYAVLGWAQYMLGDPKGSLHNLDEALRINPNDGMVHYNRAAVRLRLGDLDGALNDTNEALRINANDATSYEKRAAIRSAARGNLDEIIADCDLALRFDPKRPVAFTLRGNAWHQKGQADKALADFAEALALDPSNKLALVSRGVVWLGKNEPEKALADCDKGLADLDEETLRIIPVYRFAFLIRAALLHDRKEYAKALADYDRGLADLDEVIRRIIPEWIVFLKLRGKCLFQLKSYDRAIGDFNEVLRHDPKEIDVWNERGRVFRAKGETDQAIADFTRALKGDPKHKWAFANRGDMWKEKGEYEKALTDYGEALKIDPKYTYALVSRADTWFRKSDWDKSIEDFTQALALEPKNVDAWNDRGRAWLKKGESDKAIADFTQAVQVDPKYRWAFTNRADVWRDRGEFAKALADYNDALKIDAKDLYALNNRGLAWYRQRLYDKAIADFSEALRIDPKYKLALANRGDSWRDKGEYASALADYDAALGLDLKYTYVLNARGILHYRQKDYDRAIADFSEALRADSRYKWAAGNRGDSWHKKGEFAKALDDYNLALQLDPKYVTGLFSRGQSWFEQGLYDKALADFEAAVHADEKSSTGYVGLANFLSSCPEEKYRDGKKSVELATRACELSRWADGGALSALAAAYAETGDFENAVKWQTKALEFALPHLRKDYSDRLQLYNAAKPYRQQRLLQPEGTEHDMKR